MHWKRPVNQDCRDGSAPTNLTGTAAMPAGSAGVSKERGDRH